MSSVFSQIVINSVIAGSIYSIIAVGFSFLYGTVRFFDIGYGALITLGGYMTYWLFKLSGAPLSLAVLGALVITGLVGYLSDVFVYRKLRLKKSSNMVMLVASIGIFTMLQALIAIFFSSQFQTIGFGGADTTLNIFGGFITQTQILILLVSLIVFVSVIFVLKNTRFGKAVRAIGDDVEVAKVVGVDTKSVISKTFFISAFIAGIAGILVGFDTGIQPTMGMSLLLKGVIACIIGGAGIVRGAFVGAFLLAFIENFGIWFTSGEWKDVIAFGVLIIFLIFKPKGLFDK